MIENKERVILHSDLNNFYASVEMLRRPELKGKPLAVCGNAEDRHGVVLAKNEIAKRYGVKTGDVMWQAKQKCRDIVFVTADHPAYLRVSKAVRSIYARFTDKIESFGIDECWLDVTGSTKLFGDGREIAEKIRLSVKREIGVTVSVGVSWNKVYAKLASELKKPDAVSEISRENYRETAWNLPAEALLYVGKATAKKLKFFGIVTIGDLAKADPQMLFSELGKWGAYLSAYARGEDASPVRGLEEQRTVKSIGNSLTCYRDLTTDEDVKMLLLLLSESVAARLRESGLGRAETVKLTVTDADLKTYGKQGKLPRATRASGEIASFAMELFKAVYPWRLPVRAAGVAVSGFTGAAEQLNLFTDCIKAEKEERLDAAVDKLRSRYGHGVIERAVILQDDRFREVDVRGEHPVPPVGGKQDET